MNIHKLLRRIRRRVTAISGDLKSVHDCIDIDSSEFDLEEIEGYLDGCQDNIRMAKDLIRNFRQEYDVKA